MLTKRTIWEMVNMWIPLKSSFGDRLDLEILYKNANKPQVTLTFNRKEMLPATIKEDLSKYLPESLNQDNLPEMPILNNSWSEYIKEVLIPTLKGIITAANREFSVEVKQDKGLK